MTKKELEVIKKRVSIFKNIEYAVSWSMKSKWPGYIVYGDDGKYWTCRPVDFERLIRAGYKPLDTNLIYDIASKMHIHIGFRFI